MQKQKQWARPPKGQGLFYTNIYKGTKFFYTGVVFYRNVQKLQSVVWLCLFVCLSPFFFSRFFRVNLIGRKNESIYFTSSDSLIYIRANSTNLYVNILYHVYQNFLCLRYVPLVSQYFISCSLEFLPAPVRTYLWFSFVRTVPRLVKYS